MRKKTTSYQIIVSITILVVLNFIGTLFYTRFDLTEDRRYTISNTTINILDKIEDPVVVKVYLEGDFPAEFKRLQIETRQLLEELKNIKPLLKVRFIDPKNSIQKLINKGLQPSRLTVEENGKISEAIIFPWATIQYKDKTENVPLLKDSFEDTQEAQLQNSIQNLEFAFADALHKTTSKKEKKIAVLTGNGQLEDIYMYDFLKTIGQYYHLAKFTLDSVESNPQKTLRELSNYDLSIIAKPTETFSKKEKYTLDQFITNGGKTLWLIDNVQADIDSLMQTGEMLAYPRNLNITDLLFSYGVRINTNLVEDLYASKIPLATGNIGNKTQFKNFLWYYHPLVNSNNKHPISTNLNAINLQFANTIDTLKNGIRKTVLLESSVLTKVIGTPNIVSLKSITKQPNPKNYDNGNQIFGVLLEGEFSSAYKNRIKPFTTPHKDKAIPNKMVVISDGDIIANQVRQGKPMELGMHPWTQERFGNKEFLLNTVNFLLDDSGLVNLRSKKIKLNTLDKQKAFTERGFWQLLNLVIPIALLLVFGVLFNFLRKRRYR